MASSIDAVYMVEASRELREAQKDLLCGPGAHSTESKAGYHSTSKYGDRPIVWTETIKSIPIGSLCSSPRDCVCSSFTYPTCTEPSKMPFIVAHEFFDALPIHSFQAAESKSSPKTPSATAGSPGAPPEASTADEPSSPTSLTDPTPPAMEWREMMVSPTPPGATHADLKTPKSEQHEPVPEFQLILSSAPTRHSRYVPESSPRYRQLKQTPGAVVEVCPDASLYATDFATRIGGSPQHPKAQPSGAALIIDYGTSDTVPVNSLRGIRHHRRVNPFSAPGLVDLSADVDFTAIAEAATAASTGVEVHGPIRQGDFLELMGIRERAEMLAKTPGLSEEAARNIDKSWKRLVDRGPGGMGKVYKALAILPENDGRRRPVGFGGDVWEKSSSEA